MQYEYEVRDGCLVVMVPKELDHHQANSLRAETDLLITTYRVRHLIYDFSETEFMDSSGIGVVIGRSRNMSFSGGDMTARNLNGRVQKIFEASGLKKIVTIEEQ